MSRKHLTIRGGEHLGVLSLGCYTVRIRKGRATVTIDAPRAEPIRYKERRLKRPAKSG